MQAIFLPAMLPRPQRFRVAIRAGRTAMRAGPAWSIDRLTCPVRASLPNRSCQAIARRLRDVGGFVNRPFDISEFRLHPPPPPESLALPLLRCSGSVSPPKSLAGILPSPLYISPVPSDFACLLLLLFLRLLGTGRHHAGDSIHDRSLYHGRLCDAFSVSDNPKSES
jgi:hypothetical protein